MDVKIMGETNPSVTSFIEAVTAPCELKTAPRQNTAASFKMDFMRRNMPSPFPKASREMHLDFRLITRAGESLKS
jgi:hypothetical protein